MNIGIFVGTRPDIIKLSPVIEELSKLNVSYEIIHTGQHYDTAMSESFFKELQIPSPDYFLGDPSRSSDACFIASKVSAFLKENKFTAIVILGDTNSALGAALAGCLAMIPVAHVEAGCRSFDRTMPEELSRVIITDCATTHFAPTKICMMNLQRENAPGKILLTGHPTVDLLKKFSVVKNIEQKKGNCEPYILLTLHRPENVDNKFKLKFILESLGSLPVRVRFLIHPRTKKNLVEFGIYEAMPENFEISDSLGYIETLKKIKNSLFVATDSGGIQQEAFILKIPCLTIRRSFEWVETFEAGVNILANPENPGFEQSVRTMIDESKSIRARFENAGEIFGDGNASNRIARFLNGENVAETF